MFGYLVIAEYRFLSARCKQFDSCMQDKTEPVAQTQTYGEQR